MEGNGKAQKYPGPGVDAELDTAIQRGLVTVEDGVIRPVRQHIGPAGQIMPAIPADELVNMEIPPLKWLIEELLPEGVCLFTAKPKYHKSFLALDMAMCVAEGKPFLGFKTKKTEVLYLDLESGKRRPKDRMRLIRKQEKVPHGLKIVVKDHNVGRIDETRKEYIDFFTFLREQLRLYPGIGLIIVDVFRCIRQPANKGTVLYDRDSEDIGQLVKFAIQNNLSILVIHHDSKQGYGNDFTDRASGSTGLSGATDTFWNLSKDKRMEKETVFSITGRDIRDKELILEFNDNTLRWELKGTAQEIQDNKLQEEYRSSPIINTIKKLVAQSDADPKEWRGSASDLISASKYMGAQIYDDYRNVGAKISEFEMLLCMEGGISFENKKLGNGKREYRFWSNGWDLSG